MRIIKNINIYWIFPNPRIKSNVKTYIVMKKISCDVIQKGEKVTKTVIESFLSSKNLF